MGSPGKPAFLPREHGVWAMLVGPWLLGAALCEFSPLPRQLALLGGALVGYTAVAAALEYLRRSASRRDRSLLGQASIHAALSAAMLLPVLLARPQVAWLGLGLFPSVASELIHLRLGRERALVNGMLSIVGLSLLLPAATLLGGLTFAWRPSGLALTATVAFFWGSLLFVKSSIRRRGDRAFRFGCVAYHLSLIPAFWLLGEVRLSWAFAPAVVRLALLAVAHPRPALLGGVEIVTTLAFVALAAGALG